VKITIQYFEGCPHWSLAEQRLLQAAQDLNVADLEIAREQITSMDDAARLDFQGSPTLLLEGRDAFPRSESSGVLSCRIYQTEEGPQGAPSVAQLRHLLRLAPR
jgi:hypothetical protein